MRILLLSAAILVAANPAARADACKDRFIENRMASLAAPPPGIGHIVSQTKGGQATENEYWSAAWDHGLFKPIKPANMPWTLTYKGAMYNSTDAGKSWKKVHSFDADKQRAQNNETVKKQLGSAKNVVCGEEEIDGVVHDTFETDQENNEHAHFTTHDKYWVDRKTGYVVKSTTLLKQGNIEMFTTQNWTHRPGLELPVPE